MVVEARVESTITKHAWNADRSLLAVVPNSNVVNIYKTPKTADGAWEKVGELKEHDALVTDVPSDAKLLTVDAPRAASDDSSGGNAPGPLLVRLPRPPAAVGGSGGAMCLGSAGRVASGGPADILGTKTVSAVFRVSLFGGSLCFVFHFLAGSRVSCFTFLCFTCFVFRLDGG